MMHEIQTNIFVLQNKILTIVENSKRYLMSSDRRIYEKSLEELQIIKTAYGELWSITFEINEAFTWSLTSNLVYNFVQIGCDSYWLYISILYDPASVGFSISQYVSCVITPILLILLVLHKANKIKIESARIPIYLYSIKKTKDDVELSKILIHFSLQSVHERISMRAKSLFDVNNRLLISILSGIATYLVRSLFLLKYLF